MDNLTIRMYDKVSVELTQIGANRLNYLAQEFKNNDPKVNKVHTFVQGEIYTTELCDLIEDFGDMITFEYPIYHPFKSITKVEKG